MNYNDYPTMGCGHNRHLDYRHFSLRNWAQLLFCDVPSAILIILIAWAANETPM